jgi:hypothetical protein
MQELALPQKIRIEHDSLLIESFRTNDPEVVSYFEKVKPEELERIFENVIRAGTIALSSIEVASKIDYIRKEFGELDNKFSVNLKERLQELDEKFEGIFGEKGKFSELITEHFGENGKIVKEIFNPDKEGTPLFSLREGFKRDMSDLREKLGIKEETDQIKARTTLKGFEFETFCETELSEMARTNGDELEKTTDKIGALPRSKKGDYVVTLGENNQRKVVFECKDESDISLPRIHEVLGEAMKNRGATYGVLVVKNLEALPQSVGWFNEYSGNQLVCALTTRETEQISNPEIIHIAYRWAKTRSLLDATMDETFDAGKVKQLVAELKDELQKFTKIKTQCSTIEKSAKDIKSISQEIKDDIDEHLGDILKSITANLH